MATQTRPVLYRAGLSELMTPYGDPEYVSWYPRDAGDYGMSLYSATRASAIVGADAPANATFVPAVFTDPKGRPVTVPRVVAIYERDGGVLWRHSARASRVPAAGPERVHARSTTTTTCSTGSSARTARSTCRCS